MRRNEKRYWGTYDQTFRAINQYLNQLGLSSANIYPHEGFFLEYMWQTNVGDRDNNPHTLGVNCTIASTIPAISRCFPRRTYGVLVDYGGCPQNPRLACAFQRPILSGLKDQGEPQNAIDFTMYNIIELRTDSENHLCSPPSRVQIFKATHAAFKALSLWVPACLAPIHPRITLLSSE